ncbi:hypothetical protein [Acidisarcina polymorpha]|nr:hypothetical protein [Acidisarcina polymorpha]
MSKKRASKSKEIPTTSSILLVGAPSPSLDRKKSGLEGSRFDVTLAENICYAEIYAETQYFDAAVYDDSLPAEEKIALASVMRVRWPWMRLVSLGPVSSQELFDAIEASESQLPESLRSVLG